jgi:parvulin-like peptidyl-prolyl isomerase
LSVNARSLVPRAALLQAVLLVACDRARPDPVVLSLGDEVVRRSDFERHLQGLERDGRLERSVRRAVFDSFVEERVLVLETRRRGLCRPGASPEEEQQAVQRLLSVAAPAAGVAEADVQSYYEQHRPELAVPETVTLHQILVPTENEARDVRRRLVKDPKSFEVMARSLSRAPEASTGGLMGSFARAQLPPELEAVAFALPVGAHSEPIKTAFGYHVMRVDAREPARERRLDECREEIASRLQRQNSERAVRGFVQELLARAKVNHEAAERPS